MRDSTKSEIRAIVQDVFDSTFESEPEALRKAELKLRDAQLEIAGLRRSLEVSLKGDDGLTPVYKHRRELTARGLRMFCLRHAGLVLAEAGDHYTDDDVLDTARKFETFLNGGFITSELPKAVSVSDQSE